MMDEDQLRQFMPVVEALDSDEPDSYFGGARAYEVLLYLNGAAGLTCVYIETATSRKELVDSLVTLLGWLGAVNRFWQGVCVIMDMDEYVQQAAAEDGSYPMEYPPAGAIRRFSRREMAVRSFHPVTPRTPARTWRWERGLVSHPVRTPWHGSAARMRTRQRASPREEGEGRRSLAARGLRAAEAEWGLSGPRWFTRTRPAQGGKERRAAIPPRTRARHRCS